MTYTTDGTDGTLSIKQCYFDEITEILGWLADKSVIYCIAIWYSWKFLEHFLREEWQIGHRRSSTSSWGWQVQPGWSLVRAEVESSTNPALLMPSPAVWCSEKGRRRWWIFILHTIYLAAALAIFLVKMPMQGKPEQPFLPSYTTQRP